MGEFSKGSVAATSASSQNSRNLWFSIQISPKKEL